jgi:hypothetical protein
MAKQKNQGGGGWLWVLVAGAGFLVIQDLLRDETESILKRNNLWPK